MDAGEASLVGIGTRQEIASLDAVPGPGEMEALEGTAEGELGFQVAILGLQATAEIGHLQPDARCGNVRTFMTGGRPNATGVAGSRTDRRRAVPARTGGPRSV